MKESKITREDKDAGRSPDAKRDDTAENRTRRTAVGLKWDAGSSQRTQASTEAGFITYWDLHTYSCVCTCAVCMQF